jgi:hypothetical protein
MSSRKNMSSSPALAQAKERPVKNAAEVEEFERLEQQLHSMLVEISELSKKRPNDGLNKFKLKLVNVLLENTNKILGAQKPFKDFETFDENDLPTNSDIVVMLAQYAAAAFRFRLENTEQSKLDFKWYWPLPGKQDDVQTGRPDDFKYGSK